MGANLIENSFPMKKSNGKLTQDGGEMPSIKSYFESVLKLSQSGEEFPVDLDDVWMLVYSEKSKAFRALNSNEYFVKGLDYRVYAQNGENPDGGRPVQKCFMTVPCFEYFIARKVRPVFEVYRNVFHKSAEYFSNQNRNDDIRVREKEADARIIEAKARVSELLLSISKNALTESYAQVAEAYAINTLVGKEVVSLPETQEVHLTAGEIGNILGVSANTIGRIANKYGLKTSDYGKFFHDKSKHSNKEVETFRYRRDALDAFRKLLVEDGKL